LRPLTVRDAEAANIAEELDFDQANLSAPRFAVAPGPYGGLCPLTATATLDAEFDPATLLQYAASLGFPTG
jgi:hypothetical protein